MNERLWTTGFVTTNAIHFLTSTGFTMLIPTLPLYALSDLQAESFQLGWIVGVFAIFALIARFPSGYLTTWLGSARLLHYSLPLLLLTVVLYFAVVNMTLLLIVRALHGFLFGIVTTTTATKIAEVVPAAMKGRGLGYFGMFQALSMAMGPSLGVLLLNRSASYLFIVVAAFAAFAVLLGKLPNRSGFVEGAYSKPKLSKPRWIERSAIPATLTMLCLATVYGSIASYLPMLAGERDLSDWIGIYFFCYAVGLIVVRPLSGKMIDAGMLQFAVWSGLTGIGLGLFIVNQTNLAVLFLLSSLLLGAGFGLAQTALQVHALSRAPESRYGAATSTFYLSLDIGYSTGSIGLGSLLVFWNLQQLFDVLLLCPVAAALLWMAYRYSGR